MSKEKKQSVFTRFMDMHSGGGQKEKWAYIYIEAPQKEAEIIFYNRFGHNPNRVTCTCCGSDYSISEPESLEQASAYDRGCDYGYFKDGKEKPKSEGWVTGKGSPHGVTGKYIERPDTESSYKKYMPLEEYLKREDVLVLFKKDIKPEEMVGELPEQGYIWHD